jgi:hypothetical protein
MVVTPGGIATVPFVSVAGFKAHPTYLDLQNLRSGDSTGIDQDDELVNLLLMASGVAENYCRQPLQAHIQTDNARQRTDKYGRLYLYPDHAPVRRLLSYGYSATIGQYATTLAPPCIIEDNRQIIVQIGAGSVAWTGSLQFSPPPQSVELFTTFSYVAGYTNTILSANAVATQSTITVLDPTGAEPGDHLRIWDPGAEEIVTVAGSYAPNPVYPPVATALPLVSPLLFNNTAGAGPSAMSVSGLPPDAYLANVYLTIDMLQRPGSAGAAWPGMAVPSATAKTEKPNSIFQQKAWDLLKPFRDVR